MNSLYQSMNPAGNVMNQYNQFMQNPIQFLVSRNINIPQQFQNDPRGAVQYLINNGQMSQQQFNNLAQTAHGIGVRLS